MHFSSTGSDPVWTIIIVEVTPVPTCIRDLYTRTLTCTTDQRQLKDEGEYHMLHVKTSLYYINDTMHACITGFSTLISIA